MKKQLMIMVANLQGGGQERIAALSSIILEDDFDITFVVFDDSDSKYQISKKARYVNINVPPSKGIVGKFINIIKRTKKLRGLKQKLRIDYCFSIGRTANIINCLSNTSGKILVSVRNTSLLETGKRSIVNNLIYHKSNGVICISEGLRQKLISFYPEIESKTFTLYNPCDIKRVSELRTKADYKIINGHVITACGRLEGMKCYKNMFNAVKLVKESYPDTKLLVIGEGTQRKELEEYIRVNSMNTYVYLIGFKEDPYRYVARGNLFAFSSAREGFANVIVEGLASGVPVVSTDCDYGPREILSGDCSRAEINDFCITEYGILTPAFEENNERQELRERTFAAAIIRVFSDESLRENLIGKGIKRASDFSMDAYKKNILRIINMADSMV